VLSVRNVAEALRRYARLGFATGDVSIVRACRSTLDSLSEGLEFSGKSDGDAQQHFGELLN
jgi:hypothetical protein